MPFPLVLFDDATGGGVVNDRFAEIFGAGQRDSAAIRHFLQDPATGWRPVTMRRRDGSDHEARAQRLAVQGGVLVVIDDTPGRLSDEAYRRLQQRISELKNLSATDRLTGAWNRVQLERTVAMEMSRASRLNLPVTLILVDIDHFKRVNDVHGHLAGDGVLKEVVTRIRKRLRTTDSLFRWGGEEFVVLAIAVGYRGGTVLAEDLRRAIAAEPFPVAGAVTASIGVAEFMQGEDADSWFQRTDKALYAAKSRGRNCIHVDRRGSSDIFADGPGIGVLRLNWLEAYESGEPAIDAEHRELFDLGNALIAAAATPDSGPATWRPALASLLNHIRRHFQHEEALLAEHGYARLDEHKRAHAMLLERAHELESKLEGDEGALGPLVNFIVRDVIAQHLFKVDRAFFHLFRQGSSAGAAE